MQVKVSKTMAKTLNSKIKAYKFEYVEMSKTNYNYFVNCFDIPFSDIKYTDTDCLVKAIRVIYPYDCYACDRYLSTQDLLDCYKRSDGTLESFLESIFNEIEI